MSRAWLVRLLIAVLLVGLGWWLGSRPHDGAEARAPASASAPAVETVAKHSPATPKRADDLARLPPEVAETLALIDRGGPFPYAKDGTVFQNREGQLPRKPRGYYREFTVPTPGSRDRGARRLIAGGDGEVYYTGDHYRTFKRLRP
jgi:guanyl-specific ribonuclease Sa